MTRLERYRFQRGLHNRTIVCSLLAMLAIALLSWQCGWLGVVLPVRASASVDIVDASNSLAPALEWRDVLACGIPGLSGKGSELRDGRLSVWQMLWQEAIWWLTGLDISNQLSWLQAELPVLRPLPAARTAPLSVAETIPSLEPLQPIVPGKPVIGIYHTHSSESFIPSAGVSHAPGGQSGEIVSVGQALVQLLAKKGIVAVQSTTIHDYPSFMKAYGASETSARNMLAAYPSLQMLFDIHRDAEKREHCVATVNGAPAARILIVVATGQPDLPQPHWQKNHAFAKWLDARMNQRFPGLSRGIQLVDWRYNQHLHQRALLLEVGSQETSREEAVRSMEMLSEILAEALETEKTAP